MNLSVCIINEIGSLSPSYAACLLFYLVRCLVIHIRVKEMVVGLLLTPQSPELCPQ